MPTYEHKCEACGHEWEETYKMADPVPDTCPSCKEQGKVKRLISWSSGRVELTGNEQIQKLRSEGKQMAKDMGKDEKKLANFIGEDKYQKLVSE